MLKRFAKFLEAIVYREDTTDEGVYIRKILTDYKNKKPLYEEFRAAVYKLIDSLLKDSNYKYQIVSRTKTPERLREKLLRKSAEGVRYKSLNEIEDLAGIRVLFYSEGDVERFVKELRKEIGNNIQIEDKKQKSGYEAVHIVMSFGPERLKLSEYKHFDDLKSEIQVTSILRHTWAEIEHDFIYKDISGLKKRDPEKFAIVEQKLSEILENHIKQASAQFEEIVK